MNFVERIEKDPGVARRTMWVVILLGVLIRLPGLTGPIADRHSWNQCSTATVIRNFATRDFDLLRPQWDVLDAGDTAPNIEAEEAPIYSGASALLYRLFGASHAWPRLLSILAVIVGGLYLFRLTSRLFDPASGIMALFIWNLAPYPWFFGRAIMSDAWMLAASIAAADYYELWLRNDRSRDLGRAAVATCLAGLFKAFALHIGILFLLAGLRSRGWGYFRDKRIYLFALAALTPPLAWIYYASLIGSLGNVTDTPGGILRAPHLWGPASLLWDPAFWAKIQSRVLDRSMTPLASVFILGVLYDPATRRKSSYLWLWLLSVLAYVVLVRDGNYQHNYYQLPFTPVLAALAGAGLAAFSRVPKKSIRGLFQLENRKARFSVFSEFHGLRNSMKFAAPSMARYQAIFQHLAKALRGNFVVIALLFFVLVSFLYVRAEYRRDLSSVRAGFMAKRHTDARDLLLVLDPGSTRKNQVLYHANRRGWHVRRLDAEAVERHRSWGATLAVICLSPDQRDRGEKGIAYLEANYPLVENSVALGDGRLHDIRLYRLDEPGPKGRDS